MELRGGAVGSPPLRTVAPNRYPIIQRRSSLSARLVNILTSALGKLDSTSNHINSVLRDEKKTAFRDILRNGAQATERIGTSIDKVGRSADAVVVFSPGASLTARSRRSVMTRMQVWMRPTVRFSPYCRKRCSFWSNTQTELQGRVSLASVAEPGALSIKDGL